MAMSHGQESAKIYTFPTKARSSVRPARDGGKAVADLASARHPECDFGSGWYHEAAIREAQRARKP